MGAGIIEANRTGGTVKRVHCGWAAHAGVVAADMARHGLTGPPTVLEGRFGFLQAFCGDRFDEKTVVAATTEGLGERWELPRLFFKPYPCNHFTHAGIDAAMRLRRRGVDPERIVAGSTLGVPAPVLRTIAEPRGRKGAPAFRLPRGVQRPLHRGRRTARRHRGHTRPRPRRLPRRTSPTRRRPTPRAWPLAARVSCVADEECTAVFPHQFPAVLTAELDDGSTVTERVMVNRGSPQNPLDATELTAKFLANALGAGDERAVRALADEVWNIAGAPDVAALTRALSVVATGT